MTQDDSDWEEVKGKMFVVHRLKQKIASVFKFYSFPLSSYHK